MKLIDSKSKCFVVLLEKDDLKQSRRKWIKIEAMSGNFPKRKADSALEGVMRTS